MNVYEALKVRKSVLVCGMALGYEDATAAVNCYRTEREPAAGFSRFFD